jgi:hypothetical protein
MYLQPFSSLNKVFLPARIFEDFFSDNLSETTVLLWIMSMRNFQ